MRRVEHALNVPAAPGLGDPQRCDSYVDKWVGVDGTFTGTLKVQGQLTAMSSWVDVPSGTATGGVTIVIEVRAPFANVRVDTTSVATGTPVCKLAAFDSRTAA